MESWIVCIEYNAHWVYIENKATDKTRPCNVKDVVYELPDKLWNVDTTFGRDENFINHPENLPTILLNAN